MMSSESIQRAVLESMEHGYVFYNLVGEISAYNRAACRILGLTPTQIEGKTSYDPDWNTIREDGTEFPPDVHPIMVSLKKGTPCFGVVMGITSGAGVPRWLLINSDVVRTENTGEIIGAVASFSDITQQVNQKRYLEYSLRESQTSARAMTQNVGYLTDTLLALAHEIGESNTRVVDYLSATGGEALENARLVARKAEKLVNLLSEKHAA